ncbi:hypothetical protein CVO96_20315 [Deinococcus koreensis]|uniref:histidine kinase n=1 Tax=Deinococcus koreensis TaxID=2054903 RepID=A0A2K3URW1_9DEIO|nr:hypothetical protein CVO96_20315 [Deinococcus koreensis]
MVVAAQHSPTADEALQLQGVGQLAALLIERAADQQALEAGHLALGRALQRAEVLAALSDALQRASTAEEVAERALARLGPALQAQSMLMMRLDGEALSLPSVWGEVPAAIAAHMTRPGLRLRDTPVLQQVAASRQGTYFGNYQHIPGALDTFPALAGGVEPILTPGGRLAGFLVFWQAPHQAGEGADAPGLLRHAANTLGLALERATHLSQLEAQFAALQAQTRVLEATTEELVAFTYSVSHDLSTPLRHITSFTQLARRHADDPRKLSRYLDIVEQGAQRLGTLIDAMLQLSRTSRRPLQSAQLDLDTLVAQARRTLTAEHQGREIEWQISPLPRVQGDQAALGQVVEQLLSNAVKFTRPRPSAQIRVWAEDAENGWTFWVQDNGVGFDPTYSGKLFGIFQRLHRQEEFEGTGVGLANVRRIVARHGGHVHARGQLGEGAQFGFTLPKSRYGGEH